MREISDIKNKERYAIVSVGYNRVRSQRRLLESLLKVDYSQYSDIPLVISIDCSGDTELYDYALSFEWPYGEKYVIIHQERLGLKNHILACGDLTKHFKGIILLEDDLYVSKNFYNYTMQMEDAYGDCKHIASISLYSNEMNGFCWLPLNVLHNEADVFAHQAVATWGEAWNERMWKEFRIWLDKTDIPWQKIDMPIQIKQWDRAWSKFFDAYMVMENKYSIFPYTSLTTNFSDAGEHGADNNTIVQVSLQQGAKQYITLPFEKLVKYDIYVNNMGLAEVLNIPQKDLCVDLYGTNPNEFKRQYYLSIKSLPYKVVKTFGLYMRPHELNIIEDIAGEDIFLYDTSIKEKRPKGNWKQKQVLYFIHGLNFKYFPSLIAGTHRVLFNKLIALLRKKLHIK